MISALKSTIWVLLLWWTRRKRWMQTCVWVIVSIFCLLGLLNGVCYKLYGFGISNHLITVLAQTNVQEVKEFMPGLVDNLITIIKNPIVWIVITGGSVSIYLLSKYARGYISGCVIYIFSIIGLGSLIYGFSTMSAGRTSILMLTRITKSIVYTVKERHQLEDMSCPRVPRKRRIGISTACGCVPDNRGIGVTRASVHIWLSFEYFASDADETRQPVHIYGRDSVV